VFKILITAFLLATVPEINQSEKIIQRMIDSVYFPEKEIVVAGLDDKGVNYSLRYNRSTDTLIEIVGDNEKELSGEEIEPFLKLFFFTVDEKEGENFSATLKEVREMLEKQGVDFDKRSLSVSESDGKLTLSIGKSKRFEIADNIQIYRDSGLPASFETGETKILFYDYHKSVLPLVFPGRIDIFKDGELSSSVFFLREEYKQ
jgi:hypothetical protein